MMKKSALLTLAMALAAAACGSKNEGGDTTTVQGADTTATMPAPTTAPATTPMAGDSMGGMPHDSMGGMDSTHAGGNAQDPLIKVDSMKKTP